MNRNAALTAKAVKTYTCPAMMAVRITEEFQGSSALDMLKTLDYFEGIALNPRGRFGLTDPSPASVIAVIRNFRAALSPVAAENVNLTNAGLASDERRAILG